VRPAAPLICAFIDAHKERFGVAPICRALAAHGIQIAPRTYWAQLSAGPSRRALSSVGTVGDAYDNALAESVIGLFKTELIKPRGPWRTAEQVELATLEYVDWFNHRRLYEACGDIPPAELEAAYYRQNAALIEAGQTTT
jgi:transposase InsO family protein